MISNRWVSSLLLRRRAATLIVAFDILKMTAAKIANVSFKENRDSIYMKAVRFQFTKNGKLRNFDLALRHESIAVLLYHTERKEFLLVRQFRPAVFVNRVRLLEENRGKELNDINWTAYDTELGYTVELCAGIVDKPLPLKQIAIEEIEEECGYSVREEDIRHISSYISGPDDSGNRHHVYYAEIDESKKINEGGGNVHEGENIQKVFLSIEEANKHLLLEPPGASVAIEWWTFHRNEPLKTPPTWSSLGFPKKSLPMSDFKFEENYRTSRYRPLRMQFTMNGYSRTWDLALRNNCVAVLIYVRDTDEIVFLQRFRPACLIGQTRHLERNKGLKLEQIDWTTANQNWAFTLEPCCGHYTPGENPEESARALIERKTGYKASGKLVHVRDFILGISIGGDIQQMYYSEVNSTERLATYEPSEDNAVFHIPRSVAESLVYNSEPVGSPGLYFGLAWVADHLKKRV